MSPLSPQCYVCIKALDDFIVKKELRAIEDLVNETLEKTQKLLRNDQSAAERDAIVAATDKIRRRSEEEIRKAVATAPKKGTQVAVNSLFLGDDGDDDIVAPRAKQTKRTTAGGGGSSRGRKKSTQADDDDVDDDDELDEVEEADEVDDDEEEVVAVSSSKRSKGAAKGRASATSTAKSSSSSAAAAAKSKSKTTAKPSAKSSSAAASSTSSKRTARSVTAKVCNDAKTVFYIISGKILTDSYVSPLPCSNRQSHMWMQIAVKSYWKKMNMFLRSATTTTMMIEMMMTTTRKLWKLTKSTMTTTKS